MVGGYDFFKSEFNRAVQARRQPGSAFKPFVYLAALESGQTPASVVDDSPVEFTTGRNGKPWKPDNYDRKFRGPITYQQALEESVNVAAVKCSRRTASRRTVTWRGGLGWRARSRESLDRAGTSDLTLLEITSAYGALATKGWMRPPRSATCSTPAQAARGEHAGEASRWSRRAGLRDDLHAARRRSSAAPGCGRARWAARRGQAGTTNDSRTRGSSATPPSW